MRDLIRGLNEIAICVDDFEAMRTFYGEVIGLEVLGGFPHAAFFRIADGIDGTIQQFGIFDRGARSDGDPASRRLDHIAFGIRLDDFEAVLNHLRGAGIEPEQRVHDWTRMRSIYINDPEGNRIEWICHDPSMPTV